jgi:hypothetical protein
MGKARQKLWHRVHKFGDEREFCNNIRTLQNEEATFYYGMVLVGSQPPLQSLQAEGGSLWYNFHTTVLVGIVYHYTKNMHHRTVGVCRFV